MLHGSSFVPSLVRWLLARSLLVRSFVRSQVMAFAASVVTQSRPRSQRQNVKLLPSSIAPRHSVNRLARHPSYIYPSTSSPDLCTSDPPIRPAACIHPSIHRGSDHPSVSRIARPPPPQSRRRRRHHRQRRRRRRRRRRWSLQRVVVIDNFKLSRTRVGQACSESLCESEVRGSGGCGDLI